MEAILTESQLDRLVNLNIAEQRKNQFQEKYNLMSDDERETFYEIYESLYPESNGIINEAEWYNYVGDIAGILDPTGIIDLVNGISYLSQGDTFFGFLSMVSAVPLLGDAVAKPIMMAGKGGKLTKEISGAMKLAKAGKTAEAGKIIADAAKTDSLMGKFMGTVRRWAPKLEALIEKIPGGKLSKGLRETLKDWIRLFENVGAGTQKASAIARRAIKNPLTQKETINVLKSMETAIKQDSRLFRAFGGDAAKGLKGLKNYKAGGVPRLFGNRATRSLMTRTKFWAGFLDWLGVANFVGPEELKAKMGDGFDEKMKQYSQTQQAQQNWNQDFANAPESNFSDKMDDETTSGETEQPKSDMTKNFINNLIFGPLTGQATL